MSEIATIPQPTAEELKKQQELDNKMAQLELEAEGIEENDTSIDRSLRMLSPEEVERQKQETHRANRTRAEKLKDLRKAMNNKRADRSKMTEDQRPKDARGKHIPNAMRLTSQKMAQLQSGQLGMSSRGPANQDNLTPEQIERASKMLENNPQLK